MKENYMKKAGFFTLILITAALMLPINAFSAAGQPDLTATKGNTHSGATTLGDPWRWEIIIKNIEVADADFESTQTIFSDQLPTTNITYGTVSVTNFVNVTGSGYIDCTGSIRKCNTWRIGRLAGTLGGYGKTIRADEFARAGQDN